MYITDKRKVNAILYLLCFVLSSLYVSGCKSQSIPEINKLSTEHKEIMKALEQKEFQINAYEFKIPERNLTFQNKGSYILVQGDYWQIQYSADLPFVASPHLRYQEGIARLDKKEMKKNGNTVLYMSLNSKNALDKRFIITLYPNSNKCWVQCRNYTGVIDYEFKGEIYPVRQ